MKRHIGALVLIGVLALGGLLGWRTIAASLYSNLAAHDLARAALAQPVDRQALAQSIALAGRALAVQPGYLPARRLLLRALLAEGSPNEPLPASIASFTGGEGIISFMQGQISWNASRQEEALALWRSVGGVEYYFMNRANRALKQDDSRSALDDYALSIAIDDTLSPDKYTMYINLCDLYNRRDRPAEALLWCARAAQVNRNVWSLFRLGRAYYSTGDYEAALATLQQAREKNGRVTGIYYYLGLTYKRLGDLDNARRSLEDGLARAPNDANLNLAAGDLYAQMELAERAYCCYHRVIAESSEERVREQAQDRLAQLPALAATPVCDP